MPHFSGYESMDFWDAVNMAEPDGPSILYEYGCRAQAQESEHAELVTLVRRLVRVVNRSSKNSRVAKQATDYLKRKGLSHMGLKGGDN